MRDVAREKKLHRRALTYKKPDLEGEEGQKKKKNTPLPALSGKAGENLWCLKKGGKYLKVGIVYSTKRPGRLGELWEEKKRTFPQNLRREIHFILGGVAGGVPFAPI